MYNDNFVAYITVLLIHVPWGLTLLSPSADWAIVVPNFVLFEKYFPEFLIRNVNAELPKSVPAKNENAYVIYDSMLGFDVVNKTFLKS